MTSSMSSIRPFGVRSASIKTNKKSKYNLPDGEEDDFEFQSLGALSERDDFEDDVQPADDDDGTETTQTKTKLQEMGEMIVEILLIVIDALVSLYWKVKVGNLS
ncbi:uncharacterized protein [Malus domestica]|uniref:uncharacterized protein isoform X2 n=1 Tax=Malus domestica TaxID=3750 RepID=UPI003974B6EF